MLRYLIRAGSDIRIVASMASMLEEHYWRIEEPNPIMAECSVVRKNRKGTSMRLHHWVSLNEAASLWLAYRGCLTEAGWLLLPHWGCISVAVSLNQPHWAAHWGWPHCGFLTVADSLSLCNCYSNSSNQRCLSSSVWNKQVQSSSLLVTVKKLGFCGKINHPHPWLTLFWGTLQKAQFSCLAWI